MTKIVFKNLQKSDLTREIVLERLSTVVDKFPDLRGEQLAITLSMDNSPRQPGPDVFTVKWHCRSGRYKDIIVEKSGPTLYIALAELVEHLLEVLNRYGDRIRVKALRKARKDVYSRIS